jgi:hypothetical protein
MSYQPPSTEQIMLAVRMMDPEELRRFRRWLEEFEAECFDRRIAEDAASGKLDDLAEEALRDFHEGRARQL